MRESHRQTWIETKRDPLAKPWDYEDEFKVLIELHETKLQAKKLTITTK